MDDFEPFGGEIRSKVSERTMRQFSMPSSMHASLHWMTLCIPWTIGESDLRSARCFSPCSACTVPRGTDIPLSDADTIPDEHPFTRDGADWGECGGALACKVLSEPPTLLTFHELAPAGVDTLRDEDGYLFDVPSEAVEKVFGDETLTMPSMLTLLEVELKVDDVLAELETQPDAGESLDELVSAKTEEASLDAGEDLEKRADQGR